MSDAKDRVRAQYGAVGDAYVKSIGHATGDDLPRMVELAEPTGRERMLDIATGGGHVARAFAPHVAEVVASDLTPEILEHAARAFADWDLPNVTTAVADAEELPFADDSFDIVTCRIAPHHFPNPAAFIAEVARVLKPGGQFLLVDSTVPEREDGAWFNAFEMIRDPSHVRSLTVAEWSSLITASGMTLTDTQDFRKRHDFADWVARSRTSAEDRARLEEMMLHASPARQQTFDAVIEDGRLVAFTDTKTSFRAHS
ncbi:MAG: class I SAM-dependent methyltransferase [Thermomicrobiales bacterium]|nr:class I SAM-dependent methyltransferase [Thermomicrobiales bacterium]